MLVEEAPSLLEGHSERLVLLAVPADRGLHDKAALREEVERSQLAGKDERVPKRREHCDRPEPDASRHRSERREQHERARPRRRRILIAGQRVLARVLHPAGRTRACAEHDVLADHDHVEPRLLRDHPHLDESREIPRATSASSSR